MARPRKHDYSEIKKQLESYIEITDIPILAEFAYTHNYSRQYLYEITELSDTIKKLICKKEAQLEKLALTKVVDKTMAIFSLKQLGWKDNEKPIENTDNTTVRIEFV